MLIEITVYQAQPCNLSFNGPLHSFPEQWFSLRKIPLVSEIFRPVNADHHDHRAVVCAFCDRTVINLKELLRFVLGISGY